MEVVRTTGEASDAGSGDAPPPLCSVPHRLRLLRRAGVQRLVLLRFEPRLQNMTARDFAEGVLLDSEGRVHALPTEATMGTAWLRTEPGVGALWIQQAEGPAESTSTAAAEEVAQVGTPAANEAGGAAAKQALRALAMDVKAESTAPKCSSTWRPSQFEGTSNVVR